MSVWGWIAGILAGVGIVFLIAYGDDDNQIAGRQREAFNEQTAQSFVTGPEAYGSEEAISLVLNDQYLPDDLKGTLDEVRQLVATAASQPAEQAKPTLEQAVEKLGPAIDSIEQAADDTSNDATRMGLLRLALVLTKVEDLIQARLDRL
jgi:hypothetical protein